ncbi:hypothetical protein INS49_013535 [Diaporthe citri]|uniref:uncharacterized protein n=1 Tax=Diaporthe citri TaxID=83186 RepID=UPI001C815DE7|nr:uncharacterized protein INS49_013535 [Diaporthe citri]KAG6357656.1 hypothetical protein INS49_013535 [Diaporthe citri]
MDEVEASINHLKNIASVMNPPLFAHFERLESERRARQDELASSLDVSDDLADYPVNLLPMAHLSAVFQGREEVLLRIDEALEGPDNKLRSVLIHGLGGVGKTQTALNYAHRNAGKYDAIFWVRSETTLSINASMTNIARSLKLPGSMREDGNDEMNFLMVQSWFRTQAARKNGRKWLMIFDNVESIEDIDSKYVPTTGGAVIITSRRPDNALPKSSEVSLKPFPVEAATKVLSESMKYSSSQVLNDQDEDALEALATKVDGLPIGLRVIAGLMNVHARKNTTASKFLKMYNKGAVKLMKTSGRIIDYEGDSTRRVGSEHVLNRIWFLSFEQLDKSGEEKGEARILLGILALLCPDGVPQSLFGTDVTDDGVPPELLLICEDEFGIDTASVDLAQMALADLDGPNITVHRLVQDAYVDFLLETERFSEVRAVRKEFPIPKSLAELLKHCAWYLFEMADHRTALHLLEIAQNACADKLSELYAHLLNTVGCCAFELNDLQLCRQTWEEAMTLRKTWAKKNVPGAEEELANQLNNFGNLESAEGNYDVALDLFDRAKKIRVKLGADAIVPLAVSHMTTGRAYFLKGMLTEAMENYKQAEAIFLDQFGPKAHFMAHLNYAYGNLKLAQSPEDADQFYEKARAILEETTPFHLLLAACLYKTACLRASAGDREQALKYLNKGLTIAELREAAGDTARLLRKKAAILSEGPPDDQQSAELLIAQAESMLAGQGGLVSVKKYGAATLNTIAIHVEQQEGSINPGQTNDKVSRREID